MKDNTKAWWKDAAERLLWTFVQGALAVVTAQQLGWVELGDGDVWKAAAAGGIGASLSFIKSLASSRGRGGTAQMGLKTYSYTETGPGSAGADAGALSIERVLIIAILVIFLAVRLL